MHCGFTTMFTVCKWQVCREVGLCVCEWSATACECVCVCCGGMATCGNSVSRDLGNTTGNTQPKGVCCMPCKWTCLANRYGIANVIMPLEAIRLQWVHRNWSNTHLDLKLIMTFCQIRVSRLGVGCGWRCLALKRSAESTWLHKFNCVPICGSTKVRTLQSQTLWVNKWNYRLSTKGVWNHKDLVCKSCGSNRQRQVANGGNAVRFFPLIVWDTFSKTE